MQSSLSKRLNLTCLNQSYKIELKYSDYFIIKNPNSKYLLFLNIVIVSSTITDYQYINWKYELITTSKKDPCHSSFNYFFNLYK